MDTKGIENMLNVLRSTAAQAAGNAVGLAVGINDRRAEIIAEIADLQRAIGRNQRQL